MQVGYANALAWSPEADVLAVGGGSGVQLWHRRTGQVEPLGRDFDNVGALAFSPDGRRLAIGGWDTTVHVYDCVEREVTNRITRIEQHIASVDWSADGEQLLVGGMITGAYICAPEEPYPSRVLPTLSGRLCARWSRCGTKILLREISGDDVWLVRFDQDRLRVTAAIDLDRGDFSTFPRDGRV